MKIWQQSWSSNSRNTDTGSRFLILYELLVLYWVMVRMKGVQEYRVCFHGLLECMKNFEFLMFRF